MSAEVRSLAAQRDRNRRAADNQLLDAVNEVRADLDRPAPRSSQRNNRK
ncbi:MULTISPECIES: hypothetical protein [unclassified Micromonospora]